ncbi:MAG: VanZ family protein [Methanosarcinales archaeon]|nr:VanZ family protein [Methanosarcinales archaeon]
MIKNYSHLIDLFKIFLLLTIVYALFIFFLSSIGDIGSQAGFLKKQYIRDFLAIFEVFGSDTIDELSSIAYSNYDKILHFIEYIVLGVLLYLTMYYSPGSFTRKYAAVFAFIIGVLFAISDEIHQFFVSGRSSSVLDLIADSIGVAFAVVTMYVIFMIRGFMKH